MKRLLAGVCALILCAAVPALAEEAEGDWGGILAGQLHILVHVKKDTTGHYSGSLESPDQGKFVLNMDEIKTDPSHLSFKINAINGGYDGKWDETKQAWAGTWTQGQPLPRELKRIHSAADIAGPKRPQEAAIEAGPRPYHDQEVRFENPEAKISLAGTLTKPEGKGPFPAVVLVVGSGPNMRDENLLGHKEFLVLADSLVRRGIAVLRYDKRGTGASGGSFATSSLDDFVSDAHAALTYLSQATDIDTAHIGLIGHSEGGYVVPRVAVADPKAKFIVMMAGPGLKGDTLLLLQQAAIARSNGASEADIKTMLALNGPYIKALASAPSNEAAIATGNAMLATALANKAITEEQAAAGRGLLVPWFVSFLRYDPTETLKAVSVPMLAINGTLDTQVPYKEDLEAIKAANPKAETVALDGLNHLFQHAKTGSPSEYATIEETLAPEALKTLGDWVVTKSK